MSNYIFVIDDDKELIDLLIPQIKDVIYGFNYHPDKQITMEVEKTKTEKKYF